MTSIISFSFIVPTYNTEIEYFCKCIESIHTQMLENDEIIVIDDGSDKKYVDIYKRELSGKNNIFFITHKNAGVSVARNRGIENAKGDYIIFVDSDDWISKDSLERLRVALNDKEADILYFNSLIEFENRTLVNSPDLPEKLVIERMVENCFEKNGSYGQIIGLDAPWGKAFKRNLILKENIRFPVGIKRCEDSIFCLNILEVASSIKFINILVYHYRMRNSSVCRKFDCNIIENEMKAIEYFRDYVQKNEVNINFFYSKVRQIVCGDFMTMYFMHRNNPDNVVEMTKKAKKMFQEYSVLRTAFILENCKSVKERVFAFFIKHNQVIALYFLYRFAYRINQLRKKFTRNQVSCFE